MRSAPPSFRLCLLGTVAAAARAASSPAAWSSLAVGGGGYVLQSFFHSVTPHAYIKTDVGGIYRRVVSGSGAILWQPLLEAFGPSEADMYSINALALDAADGAVLYALAGSTWAWSNCSVLLSRDAGDSWAVSPASLGWGLRCGGNAPDRAVGDRLSAHPTLRTTLAVGGSDGRVYISTDGLAAAVPARVPLPAPAAPAACDPDRNTSCVVRSVAWLPLADGATTLLLAAVPALGLFASAGPDYADASTWSFVAGSAAPQSINRLLALPAGGVVWATAASGGVWSGALAPAAAGGGWRVTWRVAGALADAGVPFSGIAVRAGGADVVAMSLLYDSNTTIWRSADAGATWGAVNWTCVSAVPWWGQRDFNTQLNAASSLSFDPFAAVPTLYATDFFGTYAAPAPPGAATLAFANLEVGHEEVCVNTIRAPAVGAVLSGAADVGGWRHDAGLDAWPSATFKAADGWAHNCLFAIEVTLALAPDGASPDAVWVSAGDEYGSCHGAPSWCGLHSWVGVSRDGGRTFADTNWDNLYAVDQANPYRIAVHPFNGAVAVVAARSGLPLAFTRDYGQTFGNSTGVSSVGQQGNFWHAVPLAVERQIDAAAAEATFYYYNGTTTLFVSTDSGASFAPVYSGFPSWDTPLFGIATPPRGSAAAGDIWAFAGWKLYHSVNGGANFSGVWSVYEIDHVVGTGPLPAVNSSATGRSAGELARLCAQQQQQQQRAAASADAAPPLPLPGAGAGYAVYFIGTVTYGDSAGLFGSVDYGHTWIPLAGANSSTPAQGLGDSPYVLEASAASPGVLFVGTEGRGSYYRDVSADLAAALLRCEAAELAAGEAPRAA